MPRGRKPKQQKNDQCPNCGYCPHCGRAAAAPVPTYVPYPWWSWPSVPYPYPFWHTTVAGGNATTVAGNEIRFVGYDGNATTVIANGGASSAYEVWTIPAAPSS